MAVTSEQWRALNDLTKSHVCASCGWQLTVAVNQATYEHVLRCPHCEVYDPEIRAKDEPTNLRRWRRGEPLTAIERMQLERQIRRWISRAEAAGKEPEARWLGWLEELEGEAMNDRQMVVSQPKALMTEQEAKRFMDLSRMSLTAEQREIAMSLMVVTGLRPDLGEIMVYEGKPYVTADGFRKVLNRSGKFDGMPEPPHYLTRDEKEAQGFEPDDIVVRVALKRKGQAHPVYALGKANKNKPHRGNQVEKLHPQIMAETRAFRRAARSGFQDVLSGFGLDYDPEEDAYESLQPDAPMGARVIDVTATPVDVATGEIMTDYDDPDAIDDDIALREADITPPSLPSVVSPAQMNTIKTLRMQAGWLPDQLRAYCRDTYGVEPTALTASDADELIVYLRQQASKGQ